jgi:hypothetical protein
VLAHLGKVMLEVAAKVVAVNLAVVVAVQCSGSGTAGSNWR